MMRQTDSWVILRERERESERERSASLQVDYLYPCDDTKRPWYLNVEL
jgi:hypothetical protein